MTQGILGTGLNAMVRIPVIAAGGTATLLTLEGAYRVFITAFKLIGFNGESNWSSAVRDKIPHVAVNVFRPFGNLTHKQLAVSAFACTAIAALGWELANLLCGPAPRTYNTFGRFISPMELKSDWHHPLIQELVGLWGSKETTDTELK